MPMQCAYHPEREPVGACVACGRLICVECKALLGDKLYCTPCADKIFVQKQQEIVKPASQPPVVSTPPPATTTTKSADRIITAKSVPVQPVAKVTESGDEFKGWNWGAFALTWLWGIFNRVWLAFLVFIPFANIVMPFILGAKGNKWAWNNKKWDSLEQFKKTQKIWNRVGIALFIVSLILFIIAIIIYILIFIAVSNFT